MTADLTDSGICCRYLNSLLIWIDLWSTRRYWCVVLSPLFTNTIWLVQVGYYFEGPQRTDFVVQFRIHSFWMVPSVLLWSKKWPELQQTSKLAFCAFRELLLHEGLFASAWQQRRRISLIALNDSKKPIDELPQRHHLHMEWLRQPTRRVLCKHFSVHLGSERKSVPLIQ